jgi:chromosome segregation ATPase
VAENVQDVTLQILKGIQAGVATLNERVGRIEVRLDHLEVRFDQLEARFDQLEAGMRKDRRNVAGMLVMMRATAGDFDERVTEIQERVAALEGRAQ